MKKLITVTVFMLGVILSMQAQVMTDTLFRIDTLVFKKDTTRVLFAVDSDTAHAGNLHLTLKTHGKGENDTLLCLINNDVVEISDHLEYNSDYAEPISRIALQYTSGPSTETHGLENHAYTGSRQYIPNSCGYATAELPIQVTGYPEGATITSGDQIASICINLEHSYNWDLGLRVKCPNDSTLLLKEYCTSGNDLKWNPADGSKNIYSALGVPYGLSNHNQYDDVLSCDSTDNPAGQGYNYCFSRRADYTLISGLPANTTTTGAHTFGTATAHAYSGDSLLSIVDTSDHANKSNYFRPAWEMDSLIGCPLNGTWTLIAYDFCDTYDNGWVFSWDIDFDFTEDTIAEEPMYVTDLAGWLIYEVETESIESPEAVSYRVFPNPAGNTIVVEGGDIREVILYDITGREVLSSHAQQLDVSQLPSGTYILKVITPSASVYTYKLSRM